MLSATNIGINQANDPNILLPNVCLKESVKFDIYIKQKKKNIRKSYQITYNSYS